MMCFKYMRENNKKYGWTSSITEYRKTIATLWKTVLEFMASQREYMHPNNLREFVTDNDMEDYNLCHFWSNFEVADMEFWRGKVYQDYFNYLDQSDGFFYERWGDAPVHSIAASLFMDRDEIHFFDDIAYYHPPFIHCPINQTQKSIKCACIPSQSFDFHESSCLRNYLTAKNIAFVEYH